MTDGRDLVLGLGRSGRAAIDWLSARHRDVVAVDDRAGPLAGDFAGLLPAELEIHWGGADESVLDTCVRVIPSPGVANDHPLLVAARRRGLEVVGDVELFLRDCRVPVAAITGTNGKSTVTTLVTEMARRAGLAVECGANLGTPVLALAARPPPDLYVLELSSFQLERTASLHARAAVVLNISPDHLDRHPSEADYARAKAIVYRGAEVRVANRDDARVMALPELGRPDWTFGWKASGSGREFGIRSGRAGVWLSRGRTRLLPLSEVALTGRHQVMNLLAALAMGEALGLDREAAVEAVRRFRGLPHRLEFVAEVNEVRFFDDSKATNVGASLAAARSFDVPVRLIAGGLGKGQDFRPWVEGLPPGVCAVYLIGDSAETLGRLLDGVRPYRIVATLDEAVREAVREARPGDVVLLAPACASFDQFRDYAHRGEVFQKRVRELGHD
jgi:UDP-N-acetylmuramoylalanine--D-glutamate ligase